MAPKRFRREQCRSVRRSARSINVCERTDGLWGLPPELMCRVQRGKTWHSGSVGVYCRRTRVKMEILAKSPGIVAPPYLRDLIISTASADKLRLFSGLRRAKAVLSVQAVSRVHIDQAYGPNAEDEEDIGKCQLRFFRRLKVRLAGASADERQPGCRRRSPRSESWRSRKPAPAR